MFVHNSPAESEYKRSDKEYGQSSDIDLYLKHDCCKTVEKLLTNLNN